MQCTGRMAKTASLVAAMASVGFFLTVAGAAAAPALASDAAQATELSSQRRSRPVRTRVRVFAPYTYPGPRAVRHCTSWLEPEWRPSGTVIVPRMRCWWVSG
jgi:hypothetical protein